VEDSNKYLMGNSGNKFRQIGYDGVWDPENTHFTIVSCLLGTTEDVVLLADELKNVQENASNIKSLQPMLDLYNQIDLFFSIPLSEPGSHNRNNSRTIELQEALDIFPV
jgi:hypothetical protein